MCYTNNFISPIADSTVLQLEPEYPILPIDALTMLPLLTNKTGTIWPMQQMFSTPGSKESEERQHLAVLSANQVVSRNLVPQMLTEGSSPAVPIPCQTSTCESNGESEVSEKATALRDNGQHPRRGATRSLFGPPDRARLDSFLADAEQRVRHGFRERWGFDVATGKPGNHEQWQWNEEGTHATNARKELPK